LKGVYVSILAPSFKTIFALDFLSQIWHNRYMNTPKIMNMDWRALGYWPVWKDGKKIWVKDESKG